MSNFQQSSAKLDFARATPDAIARELAVVALAAGPAIMEIYRVGPQSRAKADGSPVTEADELAEAIIRERLATFAPDITIVAEEAVAAGGSTACGAQFFLVDPLDGTREFLAANGEFTVNVALIRNRRPVAGAVYAPALGKLWFGGDTAYACDCAPGDPLPDAARWSQLRCRGAPASLVALASRSHCDPQTEAFLAALPVGDRRSAGSSLKFCVIAEGGADVYPRFGPTMEWDTAAGDAVLRAAGGLTLDGDGEPFEYGKADCGLRNGSFVAWGDPEAARRLSQR